MMNGESVRRLTTAHTTLQQPEVPSTNLRTAPTFSNPLYGNFQVSHPRRHYASPPRDSDGFHSWLKHKGLAATFSEAGGT